MEKKEKPSEQYHTESSIKDEREEKMTMRKVGLQVMWKRKTQNMLWSST